MQQFQEYELYSLKENTSVSLNDDGTAWPQYRPIAQDPFKANDIFCVLRIKKRCIWVMFLKTGEAFTVISIDQLMDSSTKIT
jgi:hypothetical protein